jgi:FkbM family methyltransferase
MTSLLDKLRYKAAAFRETMKFDNRWQLLVEELTSGRTLRVYRLGPIEAVVDHATGDHLGGIRGALVSDEYRDLLKCIAIGDVRRVLDLGAHIGAFPLLLKLLGAPLENVVCVEPNPASLPKLRFNLERNRIPARVVNAAVSDAAGEATLHAGTTSTGFSLNADVPNRAEGSFQVATTTVEALVSEFFPDGVIDLCKMDIEGSEFEVMRGVRPEVLQKCRHVICEVHPSAARSLNEFDGLMSKAGFAAAPSPGGSFGQTLLYGKRVASHA